MNREQILAQLGQEYAKRREDNMRLFEQRRDEACEKCEGLHDLLTARHAAIMNGVRTSLLAQNKDPQRNAGLPNLMAQLNDRIAAKLAENGLPADMLQPVYTCAACRDEGYVYDPSRRMCDCMRRELDRRLLKESGLGGNTGTFETFDLSVFSDEADEEDKGNAHGLSQRRLAHLNRNICQRYADSFPATETRDLLLMGKSGLGKTFLLQCIAHRVAERGYLPTYTSAYRLFETARRAYMENDSTILSPFMDATLLLVDDLGTEPLMNNVTVTQLFNLLNERQLAGKHTVISTNLNVDELKQRYTERVSSRLLDGTTCARLNFCGKDRRPTLKRKEPEV